MNRNREVLFKEKPKALTHMFLKEFGARYHELKAEGFIPKQICETMCKELDCSKTSYYNYLRCAREKKFVTDTYEENHLESNKRQSRHMCKVALQKRLEKAMQSEEPPKKLFGFARIRKFFRI